MKGAFLTLLATACGLIGPIATDASPAGRRPFPKNRDTYLMESDLVYARFLELAHGGTYRQINRDERGSREVDRGRWEQDAAGAVRLHSTCRALRPRALFGGPLYVIIADQEQVDGLPRLFASVERFLAEYADTVFSAGSAAEMNVAGAPEIHVEKNRATFERADVAALAIRIKETLASEESGDYVLEPVKNADVPLFKLPGNAFGEADLPGIRREYGIERGAIPPFFFARIDARTYAREVGSWQPLHLPSSPE